MGFGFFTSLRFVQNDIWSVSIWDNAGVIQRKPLNKFNATPAKAGVHLQSFLDARFHGNDGEGVPG